MKSDTSDTLRHAEPAPEPSPELRQFALRVQLSDELRIASLNLIATRHTQRENVIAGYNLPDDYDPEDGTYEHSTPVYESRRWWVIPDCLHFGTTDDAQLTIFDKVVKRPCIVSVRTFQMSDDQLESLIASLHAMHGQTEH